MALEGNRSPISAEDKLNRMAEALKTLSPDKESTGKLPYLKRRSLQVKFELLTDQALNKGMNLFPPQKLSVALPALVTTFLGNLCSADVFIHRSQTFVTPDKNLCSHNLCTCYLY